MQGQPAPAGEAVDLYPWPETNILTLAFFLISVSRGISNHDLAAFIAVNPLPWTNVLPMSDDFAELSGLWARRDQLSEKEWHRLYDLVMTTLASSPPGEEHGGVLSREAEAAWRDSFFTDKVLMPATAGNAAMSRELTPGGLHHFYRNYLRDQLRKVKRRREQQGYDGSEEDLAHNTPGPWSVADGQSEDDCECFGDDEQDSDEAIRRSARTFLQASEDWVVVYLALHFCNGRERLPLSKIHQQFQIPSYHYKARQLGIAPPRGGFEELAEFRQTMIGGWLVENGISLDPEHLEPIRRAFDLLCLAAFGEADRRDLANLEESGA
jgi:hypothetical protein